ncbi:MAG: hypothetical protein NC177_02235 [Ruminococcus flavefaciens]|nr:hypothetical protein [Ruminococcus flavefaciens]
MLFIQHISLTYYKNVRYANYANARNAIKFAPIKIEKVPDCEVLYQGVGMFQNTDGIKKYNPVFEEYGEEIFNADKLDPVYNYIKLLQNNRIIKVGDTYKIRFCDDRYFTRYNAFKRYGHNEDFLNDNSPFCYNDIINETAFNLKPDEYGRIIYNERHITLDEEWYYVMYVVNFINCDKSKYREKMFFRKVPDYEYKNMQYLRYC